MKNWTPSEIERFRKTFNLTRKRLGEILGGLTVSTIFKWERGLRRPSKTTKLFLTRVEDEMKEGHIKDKKRGGGKKHGDKRHL